MSIFHVLGNVRTVEMSLDKPPLEKNRVLACCQAESRKGTVSVRRDTCPKCHTRRRQENSEKGEGGKYQNPSYCLASSKPLWQ